MMENLRLKELSRFIGIDFQNHTELQEVVQLASSVCHTPVAFITFLNEDTQLLKVKIGFEGDAFARDISFCTHTIQNGETMVVPDTHLDARFINNPLIVDGKPIRFYAGAPLITSNGLALGSLCVLDNEPRQLNAEQLLLLKVLSHQVVKTLELTARLNELEATEKEFESQQQLLKDASIKLRSFFESSANFHVLLGKGGEVIDFNKTAYNFIKNAHKAALKPGDLLLQYIAPSFVSTFIDKYHKALGGIKSVEEGSTDYGAMGIIWWEAIFEPALNDEGKIIGISYVIRDVSERKLKEDKIVNQNQTLLRAAHIQAHEFRGPLTTIMGLMNLIKEDNYTAPIMYLQFLEQAVLNLDDKIKKIVLSIEDGVIK